MATDTRTTREAPAQGRNASPGQVRRDPAFRAEAEANDQGCAGCGLARDAWTDEGEGYACEGQVYCCQGCADDTGCTCAAGSAPSQGHL